MRVIEYAARINNVSEACRVFGVSRKTYYKWIKRPSSTASQLCSRAGDASPISRTP
ncbi:helix-turn-helix domain-containing protein [Nocardioides sp.]|uniref:helix-turn-helix domain-containing protein n=1 Tax=Nocardioides sp. TaxID=35761 RepID=UPI003A5BDE2B